MPQIDDDFSCEQNILLCLPQAQHRARPRVRTEEGNAVGMLEMEGPRDHRVQERQIGVLLLTTLDKQYRLPGAASVLRLRLASVGRTAIID